VQIAIKVLSTFLLVYWGMACLARQDVVVAGFASRRFGGPFYQTARRLFG